MITLTCRSYRDTQGFTLIEMMLTLAIVAVLFAMGSNINGWVSKARVLSETTELLESFALGRQFAISSRNHVTVCGTLTGEACDSGWANGFLVFVSDGEDNEFINRELTPVLHYHQTRDTFTAQGNVRKFTFRPSGLLKGQAGSLLYCPKADKVSDYRRIVVSRGGRIRSYTPAQVAQKSYLSEMHCS